jgi:hypothetical protein
MAGARDGFCGDPKVLATSVKSSAALLCYGPAGRWQWRLPETDSADDPASETVTVGAVSVSEEAINKTGPYDQRPTLLSDLSVSGPASAETGDVRRERVRF